MHRQTQISLVTVSAVPYGTEQVQQKVVEPEWLPPFSSDSPSRIGAAIGEVLIRLAQCFVLIII